MFFLHIRLPNRYITVLVPFVEYFIELIHKISFYFTQQNDLFEHQINVSISQHMQYFGCSIEFI